MSRMVRLLHGSFLLCVCAATVLADPPALKPVLENAAARLTFDEASGTLEQWDDLAMRTPVLQANGHIAIWKLEFLDAAEKDLVPDAARHFSFEQLSNLAIRLRWSDFHRKDAPNIAVVVDVSLPPDSSLARWSIRAEGLADLTPARIVFPAFSGVPETPGESLAVPVWMGERTTTFRALLNDSDGTGRRMGWEYPGLLSMQCLAFVQPSGPGFYIAMDDTAALRKHVDVVGDGKGGARAEIVHYIETFDKGKRTFTLPYSVIAGANHGDWFAAAVRYREWALQQPWAANARLHSGKTPEWLRDTALWVWNRGRSEYVLPPAAALQEYAKLPVSVFWHWWHGCPYDTGFPEYLPPREGAENFARAVAAAHRKNLHAMVYMNQRLWSMSTESWKARDAARFAVKGPGGTIQPEVYNTFTKAPNASMCIGTQFWRDTYAGIAEEVYNQLGVDAIYMDQACSSLACYDPTHGHVLGGGAFWMDGFKKLAADIRARCTARGGIALAGEGCGEAWLPYLDAMLSLQVSMERYSTPGDWEPIPFFHAVYHGYGIFFGNYASLTMPPYDELWPGEFAPKEKLALLDNKFLRQFRMEHARSFVWGQQPAVANFRPSHLQDRKEAMNFVVELAKLRRSMTKYLQDGTMLAPPSFTAPTAVLDMSRLSIYAGQQGALREFRREYPMVLATAWRAPDGNVAIAVANIDDADHTIEMALPDNWNLARPVRAIRTDRLGQTILDADPATAFRVRLPARNVSMIEFEKDTGLSEVDR